jgi:hypothetical protein
MDVGTKGNVCPRLSQRYKFTHSLCMNFDLTSFKNELKTYNRLLVGHVMKSKLVIGVSVSAIIISLITLLFVISALHPEYFTLPTTSTPTPKSTSTSTPEPTPAPTPTQVIPTPIPSPLPTLNPYSIEASYYIQGSEVESQGSINEHYTRTLVNLNINAISPKTIDLANFYLIINGQNFYITPYTGAITAAIWDNSSNRLDIVGSTLRYNDTVVSLNLYNGEYHWSGFVSFYTTPQIDVHATYGLNGHDVIQIGYINQPSDMKITRTVFP